VEVANGIDDLRNTYEKRLTNIKTDVQIPTHRVANGKLLGKEVKHTNEMAVRNSIEGNETTQVICSNKVICSSPDLS